MAVDIFNILHKDNQQVSNSGTDIFNNNSTTLSPSDVDNNQSWFADLNRNMLNRQVEIWLWTRLEHRIDDGAKMDYMKSLSNEDKQLMYHFRDEGYGFRASKALLENKDKLADPMQYWTAKYKDYERNNQFYTQGWYDRRRLEDSVNKNLTRFGDNADQYQDWIEQNRDNWDIFQRAGANVVGGIASGVGNLMEGIAWVGDKIGAWLDALWDNLFLWMDTDASFYRHTDRRVDEDIIRAVEWTAQAWFEALWVATAPVTMAWFELFNETGVWERTNEKIWQWINYIVTNTPWLKTYYRSLDDEGREELENAIAMGWTMAVMKGMHKGGKRLKENTKAWRWVAEQEQYFNKMKEVAKESFKYAKEWAKEQIKQEVENRKWATDLYDETWKKIWKAWEYGETKGAVGRVVDRAITDFKDFWRFGKDFVDTFEPNNHNLRTVGYGAYEQQTQPQNQVQGVNTEIPWEQEQKSESSSFKDQIKDKVKDKAEYVWDVVEWVFTGLSPEEKMRVKYSPFVKEKFEKLMNMVEKDGAPMEDKILLWWLYEELWDKIIDVFNKVESQLDDSIPAYQQLRKDPRTYDFSSAPKIVEDVLSKWNITVNDEGRLIFTESPFADTGEMTIIQRAYDIVKRLSFEEQNANDFLNKKSQLKTFLNKYQNQQDKTVFKLLSQINHAIFVEEGHKLIPHLAEIDAIRSKNLNNINELKKGRVYKQGDEKGQLRNNFYSIVKNLTGENRKKMLQRMEEFYPWIAEEIEAIELAWKLLKRYKQAPEMAKNVWFGGVTWWYAWAWGGIVGVMIGAIIGAVAENMVVKPITRKVRRMMIDRLMQKLSPRAEQRLQEIAEKQRYASELSKADREQLERITQLIKDEMEWWMLDPEKIQKEETKKVENEQKEKRKEAVKKKKENPEEYEREKEEKKQKRIAKRKEKKENKEQVQEQPKALEYFSDVETPKTSVLSLVEPKALENKSPKALVFKELPKVERKEVNPADSKEESLIEWPQKQSLFQKQPTYRNDDSLKRFKSLTVKEYRKMQEMAWMETLFLYWENTDKLALIQKAFDNVRDKKNPLENYEDAEDLALAKEDSHNTWHREDDLEYFYKFIQIQERIERWYKLRDEDFELLWIDKDYQWDYKDYFDNIPLIEDQVFSFDDVYKEYKTLKENWDLKNIQSLQKDFKTLHDKYWNRWDINSYYKKTPEEIREEKIQDMKEVEEHYNEDKFQPLREYVTDEELQNLIMWYQDHSMNELNSDEKFMREQVDRVLSGIEMTNKRIEKIKQEKQTPENQEKIKRLTELNKEKLEELKPYLIQEKYVKLAKNEKLNDIDLKELEYLKWNTTIETVLNTNNNDGVQGVKTETNEGVLWTDQWLSTRETTVWGGGDNSWGLRGYDNWTQWSSVSSVTESWIGSRIPTKSQQRLNNQSSKKILEDHNFSKNPADYTAEELNILKNYEGAWWLTKKGEDLTGVEDQFYTPQKVVNKTWALADKYIDKEWPLEVLEPTVWTWRFIRDGDHFTWYEIDKYPWTIAQILNPQASIVIGDFQNQFMDFTGTKPAPYIWKKYDVVIGNPPYKERHTVQRTNGDDKKISRFEEYFIKKGIDVLNDGGVLAMVVPSSWLRNGGSRWKDEILKSATLVDAYRLPAWVFNNTEVNTDIIVLKKDDSGSNKLSNDERFKEHPEKILWVEKERRGRFWMEKYVEGTIENLDRIDATPKKLNTWWVEKQRAWTPKNDYTNTVNEIITSNGGLDSNDSMILTPTDPNLPTLQIEKLEGNKIEVAKIEEIDWENVATDGIIGTVEGGKIIPEEKITLDGTTEKVKDTTLKDQKLEDYKAKTEQEIADNYKPKEITKDVVDTPKPKKTTAKKTTTKKSTSLENQTVIKGDPNLETHDLYFGGEGTTEKQYEYRMNTWRDWTIPWAKVADDPEHLNFYQWKTMMNELYFAWDIYERLEQLEADKERMTTEQYNKQKAGLEKVLPTPYTAKDISFTPVDPTIMELETDQIMHYNGDEPVYYTVGELFRRYLWNLPYSWVLKSDQAIAWITGRNMDKETKAQTIELTKKEFNHFVRTQLGKDVLNKWVDDYNRRYRSYVKPDFKNLPLVVQGISKTFRGKPLSLTEWQLQGINFLDLRRWGIVAHGVGHGKTMEGVVTVEKAIQTWKAKKPLLIVPKNTMVDNWIATYTNLYPNREIVNLWTLSVKDITRLRKEFWNNPENWIKDGQVAIISKEWFRDKITLWDTNKQMIISKLKDNLSSDADGVKAAKNKNEKINAEFWTWKKTNKTAREFYLQWKKRPWDPDNNLILKDLFDLASDVSYEKFKEQAKERFSEWDRNRGWEEFKYNEEIEKDIEAIREMSTTKLEDLGIDYLCVDEAHNFKNIFKSAKLDKEKGGNDRYGAVKGVGGGSSAMGRSLYLASQYINETYDGNVSLLTATPFNNQALEVYNMISLVGKEALEEMGLENINDFYNKFSSFQNEIVADNKGGFESKLIMKSFDNATELQRLVNTFIDYLWDYEKLVKPQKITKKIVLQMSEKQQEIQQEANILINNKSNKWDVLKWIGMARRNLISPFLVTKEIATPKEFVETSPKIKASIEIIKSFKDTWKKDGIFIFFPDGVDYHETYKQAIVEYTWIPAEKIWIINGSTKDPDAVAEQYRKGEIQVLIGGSNTTEGIDLQTNGYITMNMQLWWNPTQVTQLNGRQWRQWNLSNEVLELIFLYENSVDMKQMQLYEEKAGRIGTIFETQGKVFDTWTINPEEEKLALCTDPAVKTKLYLDMQIDKIKYDKSSAERDLEIIRRLESDLKWDKADIERLEKDKTLYETRYAETQNEYYKDTLKQVEKDLKKATKSYEKNLAKAEQFGDLTKAQEELKEKVNKADEELKTLKDKEPEILSQFVKESEEQAKQRKTITDYVEDLKVDFERQTRFTSRDELEKYLKENKK